MYDCSTRATELCLLTSSMLVIDERVPRDGHELAWFVVVLFGSFRAQIFSVLLIGVGHFLCLFVLVVALIVALIMGAVTRLDIYQTACSY